MNNGAYPLHAENESQLQAAHQIDEVRSEGSKAAAAINDDIPQQ